MKNHTLLVCLFLCLLTSCAVGVETGSPDEQKRKQLTTLEIQEKAAKDTVLYKVYENENTVYLINPKTNIVQKTIDIAYDGLLNFIIMMLFLILIIGAFCLGGGII